MKRLLPILLCCSFWLISCNRDDSLDDGIKYYFSDILTPRSSNDNVWWDKTSFLSGDTICFGVKTEYKIDGAYGEDKIYQDEVVFYTDKPIIIDKDTIEPNTNLFTDKVLYKYISIKEKTKYFHISPQYLIEIQNSHINLDGYYTFFLKGVIIKDNIEINDSTIVHIEK